MICQKGQGNSLPFLFLNAMPTLVLFNKPFNVLTQFTDPEGRKTLAEFISLPGIYAAGRLDYDSEGLLVLTDAGWLQKWIADPAHKLPKTYWVQVEGVPTPAALAAIESGVPLKDGVTRPARARLLPEPTIWPRNPPIRYRKNIPATWIELTIQEGKKRQVRRMTAAVGFPALRLVRVAVGPWELGALQPGEWKRAAFPRSPADLQSWLGD